MAAIRMRNGRAIVYRTVWNPHSALRESENAKNWRKLEDDALRAVEAICGGEAIDGIYPCPPELEARAEWWDHIPPRVEWWEG